MKILKERIADVSRYLQRLTEPAVLSEVQKALEKRDVNMIARVCKKTKIPEAYIGVIQSILFSVNPQQKWPDPW